MYDPRPHLEAAKDDLSTAVAFAACRARGVPKIPLDTFADGVETIRVRIDKLIELVNLVERRASP
jgi:hypothetical protein